MRPRASTASSTRLTGRKLETWMRSASVSPGHSRARSAGSNRRRYALQSRKFGMTAIGMTHSQRGDGVGAQALGDRRHGVRLLDREGHDPGVGRIAADQRDVGAVQRRHRARRGGRRRRGQHLIGQVGGRRVRDRIVGVDDVERVLLGDAGDGVGERQQVLRLAEERIRRDADRLERQAGDTVAPAKRRLAAHQVHAVAAFGERVRQLGGDHAAAADRGVADHPDLHGAYFSSPGRTIGSRTTRPSAKATPARAPNWASRLSISCRKVDAVRRVAHRLLLSGRELTAVAGQRLAFALVVGRHVDDEGRRGAVVDEVVAQPVGTPWLRPPIRSAAARW